MFRAELTDASANRENQNSMLSRHVAIRLFAVAVITALSWSAWAACADAAALTQAAQMACCKDGELSCASPGNASDCCKTDAARAREALLSPTTKPVPHLTAVVVAWAVLSDAATLESAHVGAREIASRPHIDPGQPPYIAFSSLLI